MAFGATWTYLRSWAVATCICLQDKCLTGHGSCVFASAKACQAVVDPVSLNSLKKGKRKVVRKSGESYWKKKSVNGSQNSPNCQFLWGDHMLSRFIISKFYFHSFFYCIYWLNRFSHENEASDWDPDTIIPRSELNGLLPQESGHWEAEFLPRDSMILPETVCILQSASFHLTMGCEHQSQP